MATTWHFYVGTLQILKSIPLAMCMPNLLLVSLFARFWWKTTFIRSTIQARSHCITVCKNAEYIRHLWTFGLTRLVSKAQNEQALWLSIGSRIKFKLLPICIMHCISHCITHCTLCYVILKKTCLSEEYF